MTAHVVLVSLDWLRDKDPRRSLGHASLLARLHAEKDIAVSSVEFAVNAPGFTREQVLAAVLAAVRDDRSWIGIGAYVWNERVVQWLLTEIRRVGFTGRIVLGGPQISYAPPGVDANYPLADYFVRGYGEDALVRLLRDEGQIAGVTQQGHDTSDARSDVDLLALPSPCLSGTVLPSSFVRWETQRGCPFSCSFCQHAESGAKLPPRKLALERIEPEIELLVKADVRDIAVLDPVFNDDPAHAAHVLRRFASLGYSGRLSLQCRFEDVTPEFLDACAPLDVCLEFGLQTIQPLEMKAIRRKNHLGKVEAVIAELHRRRIRFEVSLIYGLPQQTLESFKATVAWCQERGVPILNAFPLMLLRGTAMERDRARWGLIENEDDIPLVVESDTFTRADWLAMREIAEALRARREGARIHQ
jgi:radical SAM superfamily enzyme YgiQ (UPF0313 family)